MVSSASLRLFAKSMAMSRICRTFTQNTPSDPFSNRSRLALLLARPTSPWRESYGPRSKRLPWPPIYNGFATVSSVSLKLFAKCMAMSRTCGTFTQNTPSDAFSNRSRLALLLARPTPSRGESHGAQNTFLPRPHIYNGFATLNSVSLKLFAKFMAMCRTCRTFPQNTPSDACSNRSRLALLLARPTSS